MVCANYVPIEASQLIPILIKSTDGIKMTAVRDFDIVIKLHEKPLKQCNTNLMLSHSIV